MTNEKKQKILVMFDGNKDLAYRYIAVLEEDEKRKEAKIEKCTYPMSNYYIYQKDVPPNTRVSTSEDCQQCDENCTCEDRHCLITENPDKDVEKEKKCENHCPFCNGTDLDWGARYSVGDGWEHQRVTCLTCNKCFVDVVELVYRNTLITEER